MIAAPAALPDLARLEGGHCTQYDPEMFFPDEGTDAAREKAIKIARGICARCGIQTACRDLAVAIGADVGIWGGTLPHERRELQRRAQLGLVTDPC